MGETLVAELLENSAPERAATRAALRECRPRRATAALCAAVLLTGIGVVTALEVISRQIGRPAHTRAVAGGNALLRELTWNDPAVLRAAAALTCAGLVLLSLGVLPGRTRMEPLQGMDPRLVATITRAGLRRSLAAAALGVPGIVRVTVRLRGRLRRRVVVYATTGYRNPANLADMVRDAVTARLEEIDPVRWQRVAVRLSWRQD
jgi:uncharacterized protein DUF6286